MPKNHVKDHPWVKKGSKPAKTSPKEGERKTPYNKKGHQNHAHVQLHATQLRSLIHAMRCTREGSRDDVKFGVMKPSDLLATQPQVTIQGKTFIQMPDQKAMALLDVDPPRPLVAEREMAKTMLGSKPWRANLVLALASTTGGAGAANALVVTCDPTTSAEWSSFISLFDEARADSMFARISVQTGTAVPTVLGTYWAAAFDPDNAGAFGSVITVLESTRHIGPVPLLTSLNQQVVSNTSLIVTHGLPELRSGKLSRGVSPLNAGAAGPVQGNWFPTSQTNATVGFWKFYADASAGQTIAITVFTTVAMEFRMRT